MLIYFRLTYLKRSDNRSQLKELSSLEKIRHNLTSHFHLYILIFVVVVKKHLMVYKAICYLFRSLLMHQDDILSNKGGNFTISTHKYTQGSVLDMGATPWGPTGPQPLCPPLRGVGAAHLGWMGRSYIQPLLVGCDPRGLHLASWCWTGACPIHPG